MIYQYIIAPWHAETGYIAARTSHGTIDIAEDGTKEDAEKILLSYAGFVATELDVEGDPWTAIHMRLYTNGQPIETIKRDKNWFFPPSDITSESVIDNIPTKACPLCGRGLLLMAEHPVAGEVKQVYRCLDCQANFIDK